MKNVINDEILNRKKNLIVFYNWRFHVLKDTILGQDIVKEIILKLHTHTHTHICIYINIEGPVTKDGIIFKSFVFNLISALKKE